MIIDGLGCDVKCKADGGTQQCLVCLVMASH